MVDNKIDFGSKVVLSRMDEKEKWQMKVVACCTFGLVLILVFLRIAFAQPIKEYTVEELRAMSAPKSQVPSTGKQRSGGPGYGKAADTLTLLPNIIYIWNNSSRLFKFTLKPSNSVPQSFELKPSEIRGYGDNWRALRYDIKCQYGWIYPGQLSVFSWDKQSNCFDIQIRKK